MIVNGRGAFVGSEAGTATKRIEAALETTPQATVAIDLQPVRDKDGSLIRLQVAATVQGAKASDVLHIAVVENGLSTDVLRGENRGRMLKHDGVVRSFSTVPIKRLSETITIDWPQDADPTQSSVIAYIQTKNSGQIKAAAQATID